MYSDLIIDHFTDPSFVGELTDFDIEFELGNSVCGDKVRIQARLNENIVEAIAFRAWGCATSVATADIFCESVKGSTAEQIAGRTEKVIEAMLGDLEPSQYHCVKILAELHQRLVEKLTIGGAS